MKKTFEGHQQLGLGQEVDPDDLLIPPVTCDRASQIWEVFKESGTVSTGDAFRFLAHLGDSGEIHTALCAFHEEGAAEKVRSYVWDPST